MSNSTPTSIANRGRLIAGIVALTLTLVGIKYWRGASMHPSRVIIKTEVIDKAIIQARSSAVCDGFEEPSSVYCAAKSVELLGLVSKLPQSLCIKRGVIDKWTQLITKSAINQETWSTHSHLVSKNILDWDILHPFISCPGETRIGYLGDGGKWICQSLKGHITLPQTAVKNGKDGRADAPCTIYSFGVNFDSSFENEMHAEFGCELFEFDPTPGLVPSAPQFPQHTHFYAWGLRGTDELFTLKGEEVQGFSLVSTMAKLGHEGRVLDMLKVDIEGSEWDVLDNMLSTDFLPFNQLQLELHCSEDDFDSARLIRLIVRFMERGFLPFHKELNGFSPTYVTEVSFVSATWLTQLEPACAS